MNWSAIGFDWNQVRALLATAEEGSFSSAARVLGTTQPTVGRQVSALEETLGVTLFERTGRGPALTQAGRELIEHVRAMGEAAALISLVASGQSQDVAGEVSVTATDLMAAAILPPILTEIRRSAPGIHLHIVSSNQVQNLTRREADIAVRHVRTEQPDLIATHIADFRANLYASTTYLERAGRPRTVRDLAAHAFVGSSAPNQLLGLLHDRGAPVRAENFAVSCDSGTVLWALVQEGHGITMMPEALGDADSRVERVLADLPSVEFPVWLVTHRELNTSRRIRVVFDGLARAFRRLARP